MIDDQVRKTRRSRLEGLVIKAMIIIHITIHMEIQSREDPLQVDNKSLNKHVLRKVLCWARVLIVSLSRRRSRSKRRQSCSETMRIIWSLYSERQPVRFPRSRGRRYLGAWSPFCGALIVVTTLLFLLPTNWNAIMVNVTFKYMGSETNEPEE